jgi:DNA-directed RNA polymerase specialized sigma24 family protein
MTEKQKSLEAEINADWAAGRFIAAYNKIFIHLAPILRDSLKSKGIRHHDAEDIVSRAKYGFLNKVSKDGPASVIEPCLYLQRTITHEKANYFRDGSLNRSVRAVESDNRKIGDLASRARRNKRPLIVVKALRDIDEIEPESKVKPLLNQVLAQMRPIYRRVIKNVLKYGPGEPIATAAARLRMKRGTYAVNKTRAYKAFDELAGPVAKKLGVKLLREIPPKEEPPDIDYSEDFEEKDFEEWDFEEEGSGEPFG